MNIQLNGRCIIQVGALAVALTTTAATFAVAKPGNGLPIPGRPKAVTLGCWVKNSENATHAMVTNSTSGVIPKGTTVHWSFKSQKLGGTQMLSSDLAKAAVIEMNDFGLPSVTGCSAWYSI